MIGSASVFSLLAMVYGVDTPLVGADIKPASGAANHVNNLPQEGALPTEDAPAPTSDWGRVLRTPTSTGIVAAPGEQA
jgi:hypothetical protein